MIIIWLLGFVARVVKDTNTACRLCVSSCSSGWMGEGRLTHRCSIKKLPRKTRRYEEGPGQYSTGARPAHNPIFVGENKKLEQLQEYYYYINTTK